MAPDDDSIKGQMKYLVYQKRKQLEVMKDMALLRYSSSEGFDPTETITQLVESFFPREQGEIDLKTANDIQTMQKEVGKTIRVKKIDG